MKGACFVLLLVVSWSCVSLPGLSCGIMFAYAQEDWKKEFEEICSRTEDAMSFTKEELAGLIERCDKLKPLIDKLDESARKVYLRRLQACRELLRFVLESKSKE
ncbi:MAG TPA: hypothetical protein VN328_02395 [Thermodesulfovibrionales bacterium]|nr:hypothetical protein [Thermodesulfovibrionales bacterium]